MDKAKLVASVAEGREAWERALAGWSDADLERANADGEWRIRDVLAHSNGWNRWQLVQLRCAFTGDVPSDDELTGGLAMGDPDPALSWNDGMNAVFVAANTDRPVADVVADFRDVWAMRAAWVEGATQEQLDALVGADWEGTPGRHIRLVSERPSAVDPKTAARFVLEQVEHDLHHLAALRR